MVREGGQLRKSAPARPTWKTELARRIRRPEDLPSTLPLLPEEEAFFAARAIGGAEQAPPFAVTRLMLSLIDPRDPGDPIRRQFFPRAQELRANPEELADPLGEEGVCKAPGLLHRYQDRALLLVTGRCAAYCRHCFRRGLTGRGRLQDHGPGALERAAGYLAEHREVRELILSGGDPLMLPDRRLLALLALFHRLRPDLAFRIHTRLPVVLPERVTPELIALLSGYRPMRIVLQVNHPRELSGDLLQAVGQLTRAGIPVLDQSVLLKGVNDDPAVLAGLFRALACAEVRPYYLFHPDLAVGTAHLRPSLTEGLRLVEQARRLCPAELFPRYVRDQPGRGGKVELAPASRGQAGPGITA